MANPINPQTGRVMADGCEWRPEDFAREEDTVEALKAENLKLRKHMAQLHQERVDAMFPVQNPVVPVVGSIYFTDARKQQIVHEILTERNKQDEQWGGAEHDDELDVRDWLGCVRDQSRRAAMAVSAGAVNNYRERLIKIAALAVAAIESLDRKMGK